MVGMNAKKSLPKSILEHLPLTLEILLTGLRQIKGYYI